MPSSSDSESYQTKTGTILREVGLDRWDALIVDPDEDIRRVLRSLFDEQLKIREAASAAQARKFLSENQVRLLIMADDLPDLPGLMFLAETQDLWPGMQRILMCADLDADLFVHAMKEGGILHYLTKPLDLDAATKVIDYCLQQNALLERLGKTQKLLDLATVRSRNLAQESREGAAVYTSAIWRVSFWLIFFFALCFVLVLTGLAAVYLVKSSLGFDFFPDSHLQDFLPSQNLPIDNLPADQPFLEE